MPKFSNALKTLITAWQSQILPYCLIAMEIADTTFGAWDPPSEAERFKLLKP